MYHTRGLYMSAGLLSIALLVLTACVGGTATLSPTGTPAPAFPRQRPVAGIRTCMAAELVGTLQLDPEAGCLRVRSLQDEDLLPVWPPEYTLRVEGEQVLVIDGEGEVAAQAGQEVYMGGGYVPVDDRYVLDQIPPACQGAYFVVGCEVRPNLPSDTELLRTEVISTTGHAILFPRFTPTLDEQVTGEAVIEGKLVAYPYRRCLHLQTGWGPGSVTLLWPPGWSARAEGEEEVAVLDAAGQAMARLGDDVRLSARAVPHTTDSPAYRQLIDELPGDCIGATWLVEDIEK